MTTAGWGRRPGKDDSGYQDRQRFGPRPLRLSRRPAYVEQRRAVLRCAEHPDPGRTGRQRTAVRRSGDHLSALDVSTGVWGGDQLPRGARGPQPRARLPPSGCCAATGSPSPRWQEHSESPARPSGAPSSRMAVRVPRRSPGSHSGHAVLVGFPAARVRGPRHWRTRKDPFEDVWCDVLQWLEEGPNTTAKALLEGLRLDQSDRFTDAQPRTLQRRVQQWRGIMSQKLVYSSAGEPTPDLICNTRLNPWKTADPHSILPRSCPSD